MKEKVLLDSIREEFLIKSKRSVSSSSIGIIECDYLQKPLKF